MIMKIALENPFMQEVCNIFYCICSFEQKSSQLWSKWKQFPAWRNFKFLFYYLNHFSQPVLGQKSISTYRFQFKGKNYG